MAVDTEQLSGALKLVATIVTGMVTAVVGYPAVKNRMNKDKQEGKVIDSGTRQLESMDYRMAHLEDKVDDLDAKLRNHAIKMTRLQMLVIKLEGLMVASGVQIPPNVKEEMDELLMEVR